MMSIVRFNAMCQDHVQCAINQNEIKINSMNNM